MEPAIELGGFHFVKNAGEDGAGLHALGDEVAAGQKGGGTEVLGLEGVQFGADEVVVVELAVAGEAIQTVKFEVFIEDGETKEAAESAGAHLADVEPVHVMGDQGGDLVGVFLRAAQASEDGFGQAGADGGVAVETDAVGEPEGGGLADVVQEGAPGERGRGVAQTGEQEKGVGPDVAFRVVLGRLSDPAQGGNFGQNMNQQAGFFEEAEAVLSVALGEDAGEFVADAFGGNASNRGSLGGDGGAGVGVKGEAEASRKTDGAEKAEMVFAKAKGGVANGADEAAGEIVAAANEVEDFAGEGIEEEAVDGEVAAGGVSGGGSLEGDAIGPAAVGVGVLAAIGGDFDAIDEHDAEVGADAEGIGKEGLHLLRRGTRGDVVVGGLAVEQEVADAAADPVSGVSGRTQALHNVAGRHPL